MLGSKVIYSLSACCQKLIIMLIDDACFTGFEDIVKKWNHQSNTDPAKNGKTEHCDQSHNHVEPILKHHPVYLDEVTPFADRLNFRFHIGTYKKSQQLLASKKWHALRDSNPKPSDP